MHKHRKRERTNEKGNTEGTKHCNKTKVNHPRILKKKKIRNKKKKISLKIKMSNITNMVKPKQKPKLEYIKRVI